MAAIVDETEELDLDQLSAGISNALPVYARPLFLRVIKKPLSLTGQLSLFYTCLDMQVAIFFNTCISHIFLGTFKMKKVDLQNDGYDLSKVGNDSLYFSDNGKFVPLNQELHEKIANGSKRL